MRTFAIITAVLFLINLALIKYYRVKRPVEYLITLLFGYLLFIARLIEITYDYLTTKFK